MTRREALQTMGAGFGLVGLHAANNTGAPHHAAKAKHVIYLFLNGGPSQVDTFDPKPMLAQYAGRAIPIHLRTERKTGAAFPSPFAFQKHGQSGIEVSEIFPKLAQHVDELCVIRSMHTNIPNHEPSLLMMNCGAEQQARPSFGAWVTYGLGTENQNLPGFIALCPGGLPVRGTHNWRSAFLPGAFQGTHIDTKETELDKLIANVRSPHATAEAQRRQLDLLAEMNQGYARGREVIIMLKSRVLGFVALALATLAGCTTQTTNVIVVADLGPPPAVAAC